VPIRFLIKESRFVECAEAWLIRAARPGLGLAGSYLARSQSLVRVTI